MILAFYPNMTYYMTCYNAWSYMNEYKAINILKAFNITSQKHISNFITTLGLMGLGSKPSPSWTQISKMRPN